MTTDAVSKVAQTEIWIDETTLVRISERGGIPGGRLPPHCRVARTLSGATISTNPVGASPLTVLRMGETTLVVMPEPPKEV